MLLIAHAHIRMHARPIEKYILNKYRPKSYVKQVYVVEIILPAIQSYYPIDMRLISNFAMSKNVS